MIRAVCTSDREFREGYNEAMKSPMYDDQLLQQEASLDLDEIQKYNDAKRKEREELERKKREKEEAEKPRYTELEIKQYYSTPISQTILYCDSGNLRLPYSQRQDLGGAGGNGVVDLRTVPKSQTRMTKKKNSSDDCTLGRDINPLA